MGSQKERTLTRDIGPLELRASVSPNSINEAKRTVEVTWTTGSRVERGFFERYLEELSLDPKHVRMGRLESGAPLLDSHDRFDTSGVIGVVESARLMKKEGRAVVRFAKDEKSELVFQKVRDGIVRNVSVGYRVYKLERVEEEDGSLPVMRATDWEPFEISMVPVGADAAAGVRSEVETNACEFINIQPAEETRTMKEKKAPNTPSVESAETPTSAETRQVDLDTVSKEARNAERTRITSIQRTGSTLEIDFDVVKRHIEEGTDAGEFRKIAEDLYAEKRKSVVSDSARIEAVPGEDSRDKWMRGASNSIISRAGVASQVREFEAKRGIKNDDVDPGEFRGLTLMDLARQTLASAGVPTRGLSKMELVGKALTHRSAQSTSDFPVLLENTLHRSLLASWGVTPDTWSRFCAIGSVSDFRAHNRLRMGTFGSLDTVIEGAEFTNKTISDGRKESLTASTKGNLVSLTRQAIINDDLGAFGRTMAQLGRAAKLSVEVDVYALLALNGGLGPAMTDGDTLFHANHANLGAGAALAVASIDENRVVMASQTDESGNEILDLRPAILVVPVGLGGTARQVNQSQYDIDTDGGLAINTVLGLFRDIVDTARMSGTRRYLFADPSIAPVIEVAFLDGVQEPFMEMRQGWEADVTEWKVRMDYAVGAIGYRGAVTDAGA